MSVSSLPITLLSDAALAAGRAGAAAVCSPCLAAIEPGALPPFSCASQAILSAANSGSAVSVGGGALYCCQTAAPVTATPNTPRVSSTPRTTLTAVRPGREVDERREPDERRGRDEGMARYSLASPS